MLSTASQKGNAGSPDRLVETLLSFGDLNN